MQKLYKFFRPNDNPFREDIQNIQFRLFLPQLHKFLLHTDTRLHKHAQDNSYDHSQQSTYKLFRPKDNHAHEGT